MNVSFFNNNDATAALTKLLPLLSYELYCLQKLYCALCKCPFLLPGYIGGLPVSIPGHLPWWENVLTINLQLCRSHFISKNALRDIFMVCLELNCLTSVTAIALYACLIWDEFHIINCCLNSFINLIAFSSLFYFLQKTGFLDFQTNFAVDDGRCYR